MLIPERFLADADDPACAYTVAELILMLRELPSKLPVELLSAFNAGVKLSVGETRRYGPAAPVLFLTPIEEGTVTEDDGDEDHGGEA